MPLDYSELQKFCQYGWLQNIYFINNFIDKTIDIFISYKVHIDYKIMLKLRYNQIITIFKNLFEYSDLIEIESLLTNSIL